MPWNLIAPQQIKDPEFLRRLENLQEITDEYGTRFTVEEFLRRYFRSAQKQEKGEK
jgi:hypothetical protein